MTLRNKIKRLIIQKLSALAQVSDITIILPSPSVHEVLLKIFVMVIIHKKAAKSKQRNMEDMIEMLENQNTNSEKYKTQKNKYTSSC